MTRVIDWTPVLDGRIREQIDDFSVTEILGFEPDGEGTHQFLYIEKRDTNTQWLARQLARFAGLEGRDVGYSGLKDRRAVTRQWFSVPHRPEIDWSELALDGVKILRVEGHSRKLRIGSHRRNAFRIRVRSDVSLDAAAIEERVARLRREGAPNSFGAQRFGHNNLDLARSLFSGKRLRRDKRSIAISAARSKIFNEILEARVKDGTWNKILPGELANLDGSNSVFSVSSVDEEIAQRCEDLDIHPTACMWGVGAPQSEVPLADYERAVAKQHTEFATGLENLKIKPSQRALRMLPLDLACSVSGAECTLSFELVRGCYATSLLDAFGDIQVAPAS